jgi:tripartite-type tricarboxylate transporter receptor subunit TctC
MFTRMKIRRDLVITGLIGLGVLLLHCNSNDLAMAKDPDYPTKPITIYICFEPGGTTDTMIRKVIEPASEHLRQQFIPINKPGGAGVLATAIMIETKPDGYTLGTITASAAFVAPFLEETPYKDLSGLTMIANIAKPVYPCIVRGDAPWKNWKEFIEWAKKNPRAAKMGIAGAKLVSAQTIPLWQIEKKEQVEFTYVPAKSSADNLTLLLGGNTTMFISTLVPSMISYIEDGKLRIIAYASAEKMLKFENIPSFEELYGYGVSVPVLFAIIGPKGLPNYMLKKLDDAFSKAVKDPNFIKMMNQFYYPIVYMNKAQLEKYVGDTFPKVSEIMKSLRAEEAKEKK